MSEDSRSQAGVIASALRFWRYGAVALLVLAGAAPACAQAPAAGSGTTTPAAAAAPAAMSATDLARLIKALKDALPKPGLDQRELAKVASLISRIIADPAKAATTWATDLNTYLKTKGKDVDPVNEDLGKAIRGLRQAIPAFLEAPSTPVMVMVPADANALVEALTKALSAFRPDEKAVTGAPGDADLVTLAQAILPVLDPTLAVTTWSNDLTAILLERKPAKSDALKTLLTELFQNKGLPEAEETFGPFLNIVSAWYGDLHAIRRPKTNPVTGQGFRMCDATLEVRAACQGKPQCPIGEGTVLPQPADLCGEDPLPYADKTVAGIAIEYECIKVAKQVWDALERHKGPSEKGAQLWSTSYRTATKIVLRCQADLN